jgi:hypothetical protein
MRQRLVTVDDLKEVFICQVTKGGTLDTVLLERGELSEDQLLEAVAEAAECRPMPADLLDQIDRRAAKLIPQAAASELGIVPVRRDGDQVVVLCSAATDYVLLEELAYELGLQLVALVGTELRVQQAASQVYRKHLPRRFKNLVLAHGERPSARLRRFAEDTLAAVVSYLTPSEQALVISQQLASRAA